MNKLNANATINADPNESLDMGNMFLERGKYKNTIKHYDKALEIDPGIIDALMGKAESLAEPCNYNDTIYYNMIKHWQSIQTM